jgi:hypothetical protein
MHTLTIYVVSSPLSTCNVYTTENKNQIEKNLCVKLLCFRTIILYEEIVRYLILFLSGMGPPISSSKTCFQTSSELRKELNHFDVAPNAAISVARVYFIINKCTSGGKISAN